MHNRVYQNMFQCNSFWEHAVSRGSHALVSDVQRKTCINSCKHVRHRDPNVPSDTCDFNTGDEIQLSGAKFTEQTIFTHFLKYSLKNNL